MKTLPVLVVMALLLMVPAWSSGSGRKPPVPVWKPGMENNPRYAGQYVFLSQDLKKILVRVPSADGSSEIRVLGEIINDIAPVVSVRLSLTANGSYSYRYEVRNLPTAQQAIRNWAIVVPPTIDRIPGQGGRWPRPPFNYHGIPYRQLLLPGVPPGFLVLWIRDGSEGGTGLRPGESEDYFRIVSNHKPGYTTAYFKASPSVKWDESIELDRPILETTVLQGQPILAWDWLGEHRLTVGPEIPPDQASDETAAYHLLALKQLIKMKELDDGSPFVCEVRSLLTAIADHEQSGEASIRAVPSSEREKEFAEVLRLSLGVKLSGATQE